jgi:hypothetical protein
LEFTVQNCLSLLLPENDEDGTLGRFGGSSGATLFIAEIIILGHVCPGVEQKQSN